MNALGSSPDTASLEIELPDWRQRLQADGASQEMVRRLKELCQPLQAKARQPTPPELQNLPMLLADIRGWVRELDAAAGPVRALEQRHRQMAEDWRRRDLNEFKALSQEAMNLREELTQQAYAIRERKRQELEELLSDLVWACGPQPDIRQRLDALKQRTVDRYQLHRDWLAKFDETNEYFKAIADTQARALERRLQERSDELWRSLRELKESPLADEVRQRVEQLESEVKQLSDLQRPEDVLRALRQSNDFKRRLNELSQKAEQDKADLTQIQHSLRERNAQLQQQAARTGIEIANLTQEIENLDAGSDNRTLEQARELALQLEDKLAQIQRLFLERCRALVAEWLAAVEKIRTALRQMEGDAVADPPALTTIPGATDPPQAAQIVVDWKQSHTQWQQTVAQLLARYEEQRSQQQAALAKLSPEGLDPGDWQVAQQLVASLQPGSETETTDKLEHLQTLFGLLQKCKTFVQRLTAEQRTLQQRLSQLKQRLQVFKTDDLQAFCPEELFNQLTDRVFGIPDQPQSSHNQQLESAEALLARLERQVRRRAAQTVDKAVRELQQRRYDYPDPPAVGALLNRIATLSDRATGAGGAAPATAGCAITIEEVTWPRTISGAGRCWPAAQRRKN